MLSKQCTGKKAEYSCPLNSRGYIYNQPDYDITSPDFFAPQLLGGSIEWDVDMSSAACGTINSFYMVSMPAIVPGSQQVKSIEDGYYYCDSFMGQYGGQSCPEIDLMEANQHAFHATPHVCADPDDNGNYAAEHCDVVGDAYRMNFSKGKAIYSREYGPSKEFTINTKKPFHVKTTFLTEDGKFTGITTDVTQDGKIITKKNDNQAYLQEIYEEVSKGQVLVIASWEGDDHWLRDSTTNCPDLQFPWDSKQYTISNITVRSPQFEKPLCNPSHPTREACASAIEQ